MLLQTMIFTNFWKSLLFYQSTWIKCNQTRIDEFCFWMRCLAILTNQRPLLMKLRLRKNNIIGDNLSPIKTEEKFLRIFLRFSRGQLIKRRRFSDRLSNSVVWKPQKFTFIKKNSSYKFSVKVIKMILNTLIYRNLVF